MFDIDKWQEIIGTMRKNKLRTLLTALGVFWGIFMLMVLLGAGNGLKNGVEKQFGEGANNSVWIDNGKTSIPYGGLQPGRRIDFTNDDIRAIQSEVGDQVDLLGSRNRFNFNIQYTISYKNKNGSYRAFGCNSDFFLINGDKLNKGRMINRNDVREKRKVLVIGEKVKEVLFGKEEKALGKYVRIQSNFYKVIGVFNSTGGNGRKEERVYMPITTLQLISSRPNDINLFAITAQKGVSSKKLAEKIKTIIARRHNFSPDDDQAVYINNTEEEYKQVMGLMMGIQIFVWVVGIGTLIAGIVGVSNIMLIIVKERTREIGVRKAIGATPWSIISLILQESIVITTFSGYLGMLAGIGLLELFRMITTMIESSGGSLPFFTEPEVNVGVAVSATLILVVAGALAGLMPALKAANIKPIEALRAE